MKTKFIIGIICVILISLGILSIRYYSFVFARHVSGELIGIDRVTQPSTVIGGSGALPSSQIFSFAVAVRTRTQEIVTASSEDRQWAVVEKGQCVEAKFFPYPPWQFEKSGTYFGARLLKIYDCPSGKKNQDG